MQIKNGRKITRRKKTKTRPATKDVVVVVVVDAATKEEVVVDVVEAADKVVETTKDADSMMENTCGNYVQPISTAQLEKLQEPEEAEVVDEMAVVAADAEDMNRIIRMAILHHHLHTMEVQ